MFTNAKKAHAELPSVIGTSHFVGQARTKSSNGERETECLVTHENTHDLATGYISDLICSYPSLGHSAPVIPTLCHSLDMPSTLSPQDLCNSLSSLPGTPLSGLRTHFIPWTDLSQLS